VTIDPFDPTRTPLPRTRKLTGLYKPRVRDQNFQWTGRPDAAMVELLGCQWPEFSNCELWADEHAPARYAFCARSYRGKVATGATFDRVRVFGTNGAIDTAWQMEGQTNGDFGIWNRCMASNVRRGFSLNGANNVGNSFTDVGVGYAEVAVGDDGVSGSFQATRFNTLHVDTVFKLSSPNRSSSCIGGDMEHTNTLFDIGRGELDYMEFRNITMTCPKRMWERDPTRPLVGRFACKGGLILSNLAFPMLDPAQDKLPDGRWRAVIEVWDLAGVKAENVTAELVQIDHGSYKP
jgi:hypothetical protein